MKKLLFPLIAAVLLLAACSASPEGPGENSTGENEQPQLLAVGTVYNADVVNIRMEPDDEARILDTVSRGEMFEVVNYDPEASWQQLRYRGETAYIHSEYIYLQEWESGTQVDIGTITGDGEIVNVYRHPWPESEVVMHALKGTKFVVVTFDEGSGWYQVGFPNGIGYVEPQYLQIRSTTIDQAFFG